MAELKPSPVTPMSHRFSSIQVARAIAALAVVMFHSHFAVASFSDEYQIAIPFIYKWGYLGVDLFFVVSGFIIAHIASREPFRPASFVVRRFFRIYPIYWIFCALAVWLYFTTGYNLGGGDLTIADVAKAFAIFPLEQHPAYAVGWTLEHEIIFYVLTTIVLSVANFRILIFLLALLGGSGTILPLLIAHGLMHPFWDYHLFSPTHIHFLTGILIYLNHDRLLKLRVIGPLIGFGVVLSAWIGLLGLVGSGWGTMTATFGASAASALLIVALLNGEKLYARFWSNRITQIVILIGNASFSLYLVHWIISMEFGRMKWKALFGLPDWSVEIYRFGVVIFSITAAVLIFRFLETPLIALGHRIARRFEPRPSICSVAIQHK